MLLLGDEHALRGVWFKGQKYFMAGIDEPAVCASCDVLRQTAAWLDAYFAGKRPDPSALSLDPHGTPFQRLIWTMLLQIPYGETRSYGAVARFAGNPKAARAVGHANNRNPIPILIPCHRVIGADGSLIGYAGGMNVKRELLALEASAQN